MSWIDLLTAALGLAAGWWLGRAVRRHQVRRESSRRDHLTAPGSEPKP